MRYLLGQVETRMTGGSHLAAELVSNLIQVLLQLRYLRNRVVRPHEAAVGLALLPSIVLLREASVAGSHGDITDHWR